MFNLEALDTVGKYERKEYLVNNILSDTTLLILIVLLFLE